MPCPCTSNVYICSVVQCGTDINVLPIIFNSGRLRMYPGPCCGWITGAVACGGSGTEWWDCAETPPLCCTVGNYTTFSKDEG